jgi:UDP-N-acetylenolpyruvoylglucosamine reductase
MRMYSIRETAEKFNIRRNFKGAVLFSEPMSRHTTFKVGGPAPLYLEPADVPSLLFALRTLKDDGFPYFILGGGSNIVVSDSGFDGAVICTGSMNEISADRGLAVCGAGAAMSSIVTFCTEHVLSGLETFAGLPGTAGGAVFMNARCFNVSVSDVLVSADYIDTETLEPASYRYDPADWDYKKSPFQQGGRIVTKTVFRTTQLPETEQESIAEKCRGFVNERVSKGHFKYPSAGSVFRNNRSFGKPSGKIVDEAGLCGCSIGGAQIAPWHGNFIINRDNATAADIRALVAHAVEAVREKTGFTLEPEIIFCGRSDSEL